MLGRLEIPMSRQKDQVKKFYELFWNAHNLDDMASALHADFAFRGSLGQEKCGHSGFAEYADSVHKALGSCQCKIEELVEEGDKIRCLRVLGD
jgi:predicted ester cyclase